MTPPPATDEPGAGDGAASGHGLPALAGRGVSVAAGVILVVGCVLAGVAALSFFLLLIGEQSGSAALVSPEDALLTLLGGGFTVVLVGIAIRYGYYYWCWFVSRADFARPRALDPAELAARDVPYLKVQVTTKGGALPVVERSLRVLERICDAHPWLRARMTAEVITERPDEAAHLLRAFEATSLDVSAIALPPDYRTPNGSLLKARALHHLVDLRRAGYNRRPGRTFIVHFDEETVITEPHLFVLVDYLTRDPKPVSQGPILYPLEWEQTPWVCRALESTRPFGCAECARVMQHPPPPHLHGSNLVVEESVENEIGWDFGTLEGQPFVAEDLLFGLRAYALLGDGAFGWHGASAFEQPPLSLFWAVQQRLRWVLGALQGVRAIWVKSDYDGMSRHRKLRLSLSVSARIATYSLGFPIGLTGLVFLTHPLHDVPALRSATFALRLALLLSAIGWIVSYQIGLRRNLLYQSMPLVERLKNHAVLLVATPVVGLCETVGPFVALVRWLVGMRAAQWRPTPKLSDRPAPAATPAESEAPSVVTPAPSPAWLLAMHGPPAADRPATAAAGATPSSPVQAGAATAPALGAAAAETPARGQARARASRALRGRPVSRWAASLALAGLFVLAFGVYEFAGTHILYDRAQHSLLTSFKEQAREGAPGASPSAQEGDPVALIAIPRIGLDGVVVEGSSPSDLQAGPGHFRGSPMPGEFGNVVIAARRTTYGGPFRDLDHLVNGDRLTVTTSQGVFTYQVSGVAHTGAGAPEALNATLDSRLTLITSDPAYVPDGRLAVVAMLRGDPVDVPGDRRVPFSSADLGLAGDPVSLAPTLLWALLAAACVLMTWRTGRRWPARLRFLLAGPVVVALLLLLFSSADRLLPGTM